MTNALLIRHSRRKPTKDANAWQGGALGYESYTLLAPIPAVRVHKYNECTLKPPQFQTLEPSAVAIQRSGVGIWFAIDAYDVSLPEYQRTYSLPRKPLISEKDEWLLQPYTVLNIGIAAALGMLSCGGAIQAEFVFGSPPPLPLAHRKVQKNVHM